MEGRGGDGVASLDAVDRVYLRRACELGARGRGSTSPNPSVGAVLVRGTRTLGEGFHRVRGSPHAEVEALRAAAASGANVRGATAYVSLEPCAHHGATPPCADALVAAGVVRVVVGVRDPHAVAAGGAERLRDAGIEVVVADDPLARALVEDFVVAKTRGRPFVSLKLAASLDGFVAPEPGPYWLTGARARDAVRELRAVHDAVLVGAGTLRTDDPQLTVRPPRSRRRPFVRAVVAGRSPIPADARAFVPTSGYAPTIVLAPPGSAMRLDDLGPGARVCEVAGSHGVVDLRAALSALARDGISSVLCEGGPTLAAKLLEAGLVDRLIWLVAPALLGNPRAVPVLGAGNGPVALVVDSVERLGDDVMFSARLG